MMKATDWKAAEVNPYWFVVFCDPEDDAETSVLSAAFRNRLLRRLLMTFLRPGFRHCFAMRPMHLADGWLVVNPHSACLDALEMNWETGLNFVLEQISKGTAHVVCVRTRRPLVWVPRGLMSCATSIAHLVGAPSRPWTTPYALYCYLKQEEPEMGGVFSPSKPDTSAADAQAAEAKKEAEDLKKKNEAKLNAMRAGNTGRSLLAFDKTGEQGVKTTLGAG